MKISLLTIWKVKNYGAELQAYSTVKALRLLNHEVEIIDYRLTDEQSCTFKSLIAKCIAYFSPIDKSFRYFWKTYFPKSTRYRSYRELQENPPIADIYMVGSDQVWNPQITKDKLSAYFLLFGSKSIKRVSYASSFGISEWQENDDLTRLLSKHLNTFQSISSREDVGVSILNNIFKVNATQVLDPTLLFYSYPELTGTLKRQQTLVYYSLYDCNELKMFAESLATHLNLNFVDINHKTFFYGTLEWNRASIFEWVKSIAQSDFVVTHSFHGLAMSLIYHKQFVIIDTHINRSSRILSLLKKLNLLNRYFTSIEDAKSSKIWESPIDYTEVDAKLSVLRQTSWNFLKSL